MPLALIFLAPITLQIFVFHASLAPGGLPMAIAVLALNWYLGLGPYRSSFSGVLRATPERGDDSAA